MRTITAVTAASLILSLPAALPGVAWAVGTTEIIAVTGDPAPDGNGSLEFGFGFNPALNDAGQVAFFAPLVKPGNVRSEKEGVFRGDGTTITMIALEDDAGPDGNGQIVDVFRPIFNNAGQAAFRGSLKGVTSGGTLQNSVFRGDGITLTQIALQSEATPDGNGSFLFFFDPVLNDAGQAAFTATLFGTSSGGSEGIFLGDGITLTQIAREGDAAPDGNGSFSGFSTQPALNNAGQVAFSGSLNGTSGGIGDGDTNGIFRDDGVTGLMQIVRGGETAPDGNGSFFGFNSPPALNNAGQAVFRASIDLGDGGVAFDEYGIFRGDGTTLTQIAREGDATPDGDGSFSDFFSRTALNDAEQVAFRAELAGSSDGSSEGIFRGDGATLTEIARAGDAAPDGNGSFFEFADNIFDPLNPTHLVLNDVGQAAFFAKLTGTSGGDSDDTGIFFYDDALGLIQVAREGDSFLGSTITFLNLSDEAKANNLDDRGVLNEPGQVAYVFGLADVPGVGIAIWTVPEPGTALVLMMGAMGLLLKGRGTPKGSAT